MDTPVILHNGTVYTCNRNFDTASAVAIRGDKIIAVGSLQDVRGELGPNARLVDLDGSFVTPGLTDTHNHLSSVGLTMSGTDIRGIRSISDLQARIDGAVGRSAKGEWIVTGTVGESVISHELAEGRYPTARELDAVAPDNPVCIKAFHVGILNSAAMVKLGITAVTKAPAGGSIGKTSDSGGQLDGRFYETAWHVLVEERLPETTQQDRVEAIKLASRHYAAAGITAVGEHGINWKTWAAYREADSMGYLSQRVHLHLRVGPGSEQSSDKEAIQAIAQARRDQPRDARVSLGGAKVFIDGGVALGTALFHEPYTAADGRQSCGVEVTPPDRLRQIAALCLEHDLQLSQHASGDRAINQVLDAYESLDAASAIRRNRFILVHCQFPHERDFERINRLGVHVAAQTLFLYNMGNGYLHYQGANGAHAVPLREFIDRGCKVALGTDAPVNQYFPSAALWHATTRINKATGKPMGAEHRITPQEALSLYTREAAYLDFREQEAGMIQRGNAADLAIFRKDPLQLSSMDCEEPLTTRCTIAGGEVVHGSLTA